MGKHITFDLKPYKERHKAHRSVVIKQTKSNSLKGF